MNQKAQRSEVVFPPLLNLQDDHPRIASDFRSVEKINAPYLNGMLSPMWKQEYEYTNKPVYDYKNNRYEIVDGWLTKNGENLFRVENKHLEKEDVTDLYKNYLDFNFDKDGNIATLEWETETNDVVLKYNDKEVTARGLFIEGTLIATRIRVINDTAVGVIIYESNNTYHLVYLNSEANRSANKTIIWRNQYPKSDVSQTFASRKITINTKQINPTIFISNPKDDLIAVSVLSNSNICFFTRENGYYTLIDDNGTITDDITAANGSSTETIQTYTNSNFTFSWQQRSIVENIYCINYEDAWVDRDTLDPIPDSDSIYFSPAPNGQTKIIDDVSYDVYVAKKYTNTIQFYSFVDDLHNKAASLAVTFSDGHTETESYVNDQLSITHSDSGWQNIAVSPASYVITYDGNTYTPTSLSFYTLSIEDTPTTVTAPYITMPNVFLDNGRMYALYTIPEAGTTSGSMPISVPTNTLIVESADLDDYSDWTAFTINIAESHLVNQYTTILRSNSIGVAQNFWASSLTMSSSNMKAPWNLYVNKETETSASSTAKYTQYTNSNACDMLYYAGTVYNGAQKFYSLATVGSEDCANMPQGGFRVQLNDRFYINYQINSSGFIVIDSISTAETNDTMGTMIVPVGSVADNTDVKFSDNFFVYKDNKNRIYKVEIKDNALLSAVFDNKYIIINTPSYWNMWDESSNRKYHYATDYNNRMKVGFSRQVYRSDISYFTYQSRKKYVSTINASYNRMPRLTVSSLLPVAYGMSHLPQTINVDTFHFYGCQASESRDIQAIDIYKQDVGTDLIYFVSAKVFHSSNEYYRDAQLYNVAYSSSSFIYPTSLLSTFINGAGNNDFVSEDSSKYPLIYNNQNKPLFIYNYSSGLDVEDVRWFFVIQGQYYAVIGEKLYAMIYSGGTISQQDAIVDIRDLKYIGNTPSIAFFVNPYTKQVYSFTGDANLSQIFDASKFEFELINDEVTHWYDESNQSIYIKTNKGLLVFGPQNTYLLEEFLDVTDVEFTNGIIHIINDKATSLAYYPTEGFDDLPINIETSFWGLGANEITSIDRWQIVLYDPLMREQDVELSVRSLTDVSTTTESKKWHINANEWDKWSHSVLVSFSPKLIRGKGIRLTIKTHSSVQSIVPHVADQKTAQTTNRRFEV